MNERNVEALAALVLGSFDESGHSEMHECPDHRAVARFLASRGVLVPSALTDEQAARFDVYDHGVVRTALERIAKGEPA
jgi:hypothetical protein